MNRSSPRGKPVFQTIVVLALVSIVVLLAIRAFRSPTHSSSPSTFTPHAGLKLTKHVVYGPSPYQYMDIFMPSHIDRAVPVVMFVHGGAFINSGTASLYPEAAAVAKAGWVGVSVNYRVDGYPHESDDVLAAVQWIHTHAASYHIDPNRIALFGSSAGGNLAAQAATVAHQEHKNVGIAAVVSWSGPMNFVSFAQTVSKPNLIRIGTIYLGCPLSSCPSVWSEASPIDHVAPGDPPMYLANSTNEVVPYSQATSMVSKLRAAGDTAQLLTVDGNRHALQYASQAFQPSISWLTRYLGPLRGTLAAVPDGPAM